MHGSLHSICSLLLQIKFLFQLYHGYPPVRLVDLLSNQTAFSCSPTKNGFFRRPKQKYPGFPVGSCDDFVECRRFSGCKEYQILLVVSKILENLPELQTILPYKRFPDRQKRFADRRSVSLSVLQWNASGLYQSKKMDLINSLGEHYRNLCPYGGKPYKLDSQIYSFSIYSLYLLPKFPSKPNLSIEQKAVVIGGVNFYSLRWVGYDDSNASGREFEDLLNSSSLVMHLIHLLT
ncbi:hypothetical protein NPIL_20971 [Nephila pilipes]|uniref:Uncharacterized protein n=1 Tax=Nephila pilipes TaxID=299642 RepID=A0A8X6N794_NEPPI|nr:hypothetical protein NPIL_20971 [Nephila pilipes]